MSPATVRRAAQITGIAPQFLVDDLDRAMFSELQMRGAEVTKPLEGRPWACHDFYVEDPDGYILCFSEQNA